LCRFTQAVAELWGFTSQGAFPQIFSTLGGTTSDTKTFYRCKNGTELVYYHAEFGGTGTFPTDMGKKLLIFLFFLSIMPLNGRVCANNFAIKAFE